MIIREEEKAFILFNQHDHGQLAGQLARSWGNTSFRLLNESIVTAADLHDVGWVDLDRSPVWNREEKRPYTFLDEPLDRRIPAYRFGINQVIEIDPYAGLLCSQHYTSFFTPEVAKNLGRIVEAFIKDEKYRQTEISLKLNSSGQSCNPEVDLGILKLLDNISLYVCLNKPGTTKGSEHPWFRDGFKPTKLYTGGSHPGEVLIKFQAHWANPSTIKLTPYPFEPDFFTTIPFKRVLKTQISDLGYAQSFDQTPFEELTVYWGPVG